MDIKKDAYGQEVWAFFRKKNSYEVVERDDGFVDLSGGAPHYFADFKDWPKIEKQAVKLAKGRILDIGAGAGRVSLYLQRKHYNVTAIDNSPLAIRVCRKRGVRQAKVLPIEKIDILKKKNFDTVVMFGTNFGLFGSFKKAKILLKRLYKITSPDALILAESNDIYKTDNPAHRAYQRFNRKRGRMPGQLRIRIRFKTYIGNWFDYLMVSKNQMKEILKGTGWKVRKFINSSKSIYIAAIGKE